MLLSICESGILMRGYKAATLVSMKVILFINGLQQRVAYPWISRGTIPLRYSSGSGACFYT